MFDISWLLSLAAHFPLEGMDMRFMQQALLALVLLAPMTAALGVQVVHYRMAFFSDAVGHSAFAGVAVGLLLGIHITIGIRQCGNLGHVGGAEALGEGGVLGFGAGSSCQQGRQNGGNDEDGETDEEESGAVG